MMVLGASSGRLLARRGVLQEMEMEMEMELIGLGTLSEDRLRYQRSRIGEGSETGVRLSRSVSDESLPIPIESLFRCQNDSVSSSNGDRVSELRRCTVDYQTTLGVYPVLQHRFSCLCLR